MINTAKRIITHGVHSDVLPRRGDGAEPISQADGMEGFAAARVLARVVSRAPTVCPELVIWRSQGSKNSHQGSGTMLHAEGVAYR